MYECPDCRQAHDDPFEAAFSAFARCTKCGMLDEFHGFRSLGGDAGGFKQAA